MYNLSIELPKELTQKDISLMSNKITEANLLDNKLHITLIAPQHPQHEIWADEHSKYYTNSFLRKVLLIKLNSLLKDESSVKKDTINTFVSLFKNGITELIEVCNSEEQLFTRLLKNAQKQGLVVHEEDTLNITTGNCLGLTIVSDTISRAEIICKLSEIAFAMSFEVLNGRIHAFLPCVHQEKNHEGQAKCARNIRALLTNSGLTSDLNQKRAIQHKKVQDSYSLRCVPQVHGISYDVVKHSKTRLQQQLNNPQLSTIILEGQHYPIYPNTQKSLQLIDQLSLALNQIGSISLIRSQRLLNKYTSKLPFQITSLKSYQTLRSLYWDCSSKFLQNKVLCYPVSADTINGDSYIQDISYSMKNVDRKHREIFHNLFGIVGLELLVSLECLEGIKQSYTEKLTPQLEKESELANGFLRKGEPITNQEGFQKRLDLYLRSLCV